MRERPVESERVASLETREGERGRIRVEHRFFAEEHGSGLAGESCWARSASQSEPREGSGTLRGGDGVRGPTYSLAVCPCEES